ncbi:MAG: ABC transporter ATP-binding protein, partial [Mesorhizobium sp.]
LEVNDGEFVVFVGPSGCGKSTLLRVIAGLEDSTSGRVVIDGQDVSVTPPAKRGIAMVFQTYALYPHLTVKNNMGLGLKQAGTPAAEIDRRIGVASSMLSLEPYLERRPAELSGGQRQRVAIGRAVVREPKLFLFDEPLSNLDAALRVNTRLEIAQLHRRLKATMIYVTHDQVGARLGETAKTVGVRPEHLTVDTTSGAWKGTVVHAEHLGADTNLYLDCEKAGLLTVRIFGVYNAEPGSTLYATPDPAKTYRFGADGRVLK